MGGLGFARGIVDTTFAQMGSIGNEIDENRGAGYTQSQEKTVGWKVVK